jgi:tRNA pseudouridine55 synthase
MNFTRDSLIEGEKILIDKELSWTSFDVVKKVKYKLQNKFNIRNLKVGHAGTLDPLATGLIILCTGKATKQINEIQNLYKTYTTTIKLGETTPSFDLETSVDHQFPIQHITSDFVIEVLDGFTGDMEQVPPTFSAKKYEGKRAYEFARKGQEIELKPKKISISTIELIKFEIPLIYIKVTCSKGTYIRSLARDIGVELKSGAHLVALERVSIGDYNISDGMKINEFEKFVNGL